MLVRLCLMCPGSLAYQGNPVCREVEYRFAVLAYIKNITYLDYGTIDPTEVLQVCGAEQCSVAWRRGAASRVEMEHALPYRVSRSDTCTKAQKKGGKILIMKTILSLLL